MIPVLRTRWGRKSKRRADRGFDRAFCGCRTQEVGSQHVGLGLIALRAKKRVSLHVSNDRVMRDCH